MLEDSRFFTLERVLSDHITQVKSISNQYYIIQKITPKLQEQFEIKNNQQMTARDPHIVQCYYKEEYKGEEYMLVEHMQHGSLETYQKSFSLNMYDMLALVRHVTLGVKSLHKQNKVHGAIHKDHVFINEHKGKMYGALQYYGRFKIEEERLRSESDYWLGLPTAVVEGDNTLKPIDDIYGLGVLLYELCMKQRLFSSITLKELCKERNEKKIIYDPQKISEDIQAICEKALGENEQEYVTCDELLKDIEIILKKHPSQVIESQQKIDNDIILLSQDILKEEIHENLSYMLNQEGLGGAYRHIALSYSQGNYLVRNYEKALYYEQKAAIEERDMLAMNHLGILYEDGVFVEKNYQMAERYYQMALDSGEKESLAYLGAMYQDGKLGEADSRKAKELYERGVALGCSKSMCLLGKLYELGEAVEQDFGKAKELYERALELGSSEVYHFLALLYQDGNGVDQSYEEAFKYLVKGAEGGSASAINQLGIYYENGYGVEADSIKAVRCYEDAIEKGSELALYNLALVYDFGLEGIESNEELAIDCYQILAERGDEDAMFNLALTYEEVGNYEKAKECYEKLITTDNVIVYHNLGMLYRDGRGVGRNYQKAHELFDEAITLGDYHNSLYNMALLYTHGLGVEKDHDKAYNYMKRAIEEGSDEYWDLWCIKIKKDFTYFFGK